MIDRTFEGRKSLVSVQQGYHSKLKDAAGRFSENSTMQIHGKAKLFGLILFVGFWLLLAFFTVKASHESFATEQEKNRVCPGRQLSTPLDGARLNLPLQWQVFLLNARAGQGKAPNL